MQPLRGELQLPLSFSSPALEMFLSSQKPNETTLYDHCHLSDEYQSGKDIET